MNPENSYVIILENNPDFVERGVLWYKENKEKILRSLRTNIWWGNHSILIEQNKIVKMTALLRDLSNLGYTRVNLIQFKGEYAVRGSALEISPINEDAVYTLNFWGDTIEGISRKEESLGFPSKKNKKELESFLKSVKEGDYLVHIDHGIGIYRGIEKKEDGEDYFVLEYASGDKLFVPLNLYTKLTIYIAWSKPVIHRLGSNIWKSTKKKVKEETEKLARELLELYKQREMSARPAYEKDEEAEKSFALSFEHIETGDQIKTINAVISDLERDRPMDRLVCGDVGFGKTEVSLRAVFRVVLNGRQVAFLTPTTILANQHYNNFKERFKNFPIKIAMLSRFTPAAEAKEMIKNIAAGKIDLVVGTHRLLSADISFKDLGLVIIDEEQRFGVRQKEAFVKTRQNIDVLSLSATPIPRTLYFSLSGLRDISNIETPPPERLPIHTYVMPFDKKMVKTAVMNEIKRGGQVFYLHNKIETMGNTIKMLSSIMPGIRIEFVHAKLNEKEINRIISDFLDKKFDVLVTTTIIENGLDMPNVNTLIVEDAVRLGLSQAHQLRGRIGRRDKQAYAYFFYLEQELKGEAKERLDTLEELQELGAGYKISLKDLEIRGAGNILGKDQSGAILEVGLNLYCQMLNEAKDEMMSYIH